MLHSIVTTTSSQFAPVLAEASIDLDGTVLVQFVAFWLVFFFLHFVLFRPYLRAVEAREEGVGGAREDATEMQERADEVIEEYEEKMRQARRDAQDVRESLRNQGLQEQNDLIQEVRDEIQSKLQDERARIQDKVDEARGDIEARAETLAESVVAKILPR